MKKSHLFIIIALFPFTQYSIAKQDVLGIGQALYDVYVECKDYQELEHYLTLIGTTKGNSAPISGSTAKTLFRIIETPLKCYAGGTTSNTVTAIANLGGNAGFIGTVGNDMAGKCFKQDMKKSNITVKNMIQTIDDAETGIVFSFIPPDGERTMGAWLGVSSLINEENITPDLISEYKVVLSDVYMLYNDTSKLALYKTFSTAQSCDVKIALNLASIYAVDTHRAEIKALLPSVTILFGNEDEMKTLYETDDLGHIIETLQSVVAVAVITRGDNGAIIITPTDFFNTPSKSNISVVDTTGAGDLFAAGFLYGYTCGMDLTQAAVLAHECAAIIIQQIGAHLEQTMRHLTS